MKASAERAQRRGDDARREIGQIISAHSLTRGGDDDRDQGEEEKDEGCGEISGRGLPYMTSALEGVMEKRM